MPQWPSMVIVKGSNPVWRCHVAVFTFSLRSHEGVFKDMFKKGEVLAVPSCTTFDSENPFSLLFMAPISPPTHLTEQENKVRIKKTQ